MRSITSMRRLAIGFGIAAPLTLIAHPATAKGPVVLPYFLPKTTVSATFSQRLTACPDDAAKNRTDTTHDRVKVVTKWSLSADTVPDYAMPIMVDASSGFLAKRNVGLKYNADGTLNSLNADSTGQGGAVVASVIKLAATLAPLAAPGLSRGFGIQTVTNPGSMCTEAAKTALKDIGDLNDKIAKIQDAVVDQTATAAQVAALADFQARRSALEAQLTIKSKESFAFDPANPDRFDPASLLDPNDPDHILYDRTRFDALASGSRPAKYFTPLDYKAWFGANAPPDYIPGAKVGFKASIDIDQTALTARRLAPAVARPAGEWNVKAQQKMYFRWPVPASLSVVACKDPREVNCDKDAELTAAMTNISLDFSMPQLAYLTAVPVGSAGIFGSRTVKASFDETGAPVELSYGSDPGADAIAGTIDAAGGAAVAIHDRKLAALKYQLDVEDTKAKLAAARAAAAAEE